MGRVRFISENRMGEMRWASEEVTTIRFCPVVFLDETSKGRSKLVRRKGPIWFVANCNSIPSGERVWELMFMPALLKIRSIPFFCCSRSVVMVLTARRTLA